MNLETSFGRWLRHRRRALDLTQDDLARRVGCAVVTIQKLEADERRPSRLLAERLADGLQVAADQRAALIALARAEPYPTPAPAQPADVPHHPTERRSRSLPAPLTRLIGRKPDIAAVRNALLRGETRLLTLLGPPGIGKTRLSLAVAQDVQAAFRDGASFVALAPLSDPTLVLATIAQTLGITETFGRPLLETLKTALQAQRRLLVLDNFEQLLEAAPLVVALLEACVGLKALITSRAALHVRGERLYALPPLLLPDLTRLPAPLALARAPAVALFVERAQAVLPAFRLTEQNAAVVAAICVRLDGLPLAIELAATRITRLPAEAMLARLEQRLNLLTDGPRDLPPRHQTLRAAIAWSYELLGADEQMLFRRLGVFVGGWTPAAAEAVCGSWELGVGSWGAGATPPTPISQLPTPILDGLATLVDTSLLQRAKGRDGEPRFTMLETIREYALERLEESGEAEAVRQRHAAYYVALAEQAEAAFRGPQARAWMDRLEADHDNLRAALIWSQVAPDRAEVGLRIVGALLWFWGQRSRAEGEMWLTSVLSRPEVSAKTAAYAKALTAASVFATYQGHFGKAVALGQQALALARELTDQIQIAWALNALGELAKYHKDLSGSIVMLEEGLAIFQAIGERYGIARTLSFLGEAVFSQGDPVRGVRLLEQSLALAREMGDMSGIADLLSVLGHLALQQGDAVRAIPFLEESLILYQAAGDMFGAADALNHLGMAELELEHFERAEMLFAESMDIFRDQGAKLYVAWAKNNAGDLARIRGDYTRAATCYDESLALHEEFGQQNAIAWQRCSQGFLLSSQGDNMRAIALFVESLRLSQELHDQERTARCLIGLAGVVANQRQPANAVHLLGAAEALLEGAGVHLWFADRVHYEHIIATVRALLDEAAFAAAWAEGRAMTLEQAVAYALEAAPAAITVVDSEA